MANIPFIFCAFANDYTRYLKQLPHEANDIAALFRDKQHLCNIEVLSNMRPNDLLDVRIKLKNDIHIAHYGGHTNGQESLLTNDIHQRQLFDNEAFAEFLISLPNLKLAFINGCLSAEMVNQLYNAGVPAVIGTTTKIDDFMAFQLSVAFYKGISQQLTIADAWNAAAALIKGLYKRDNCFRGVSFDDDDIYTDNPNAAWFIKLHEGAGDWKLQNIVVGRGENPQRGFAPTSPSFPRFHNTSQTPLSHKILGRDTDLAAVHQKLLAQKQCVVLNGLGGIGKSSLAKLYIQQYHADYQHIIWLYEKATATDILLTDIELQIALQIRDKVLQCIQAQDERGAIATIIQALNELPNPVLLIADNVSNLKAFYDLIQHLNKSHYHILFTSRQETTALPFHKLNTLDKIAALEVFMLHYDGEDHVSLDKYLSLKNNTALPLILETAQYHTLTIELLAKILRNSNTLTPEKLLARLQEQLLIPKITQTIDTAYTPEQATLLEILLAAFDISGLSQTPKALEILAEWAVLPATPIPHTHLLALFGVTDDSEDAFDTALTFLIQNAWIQKGEEEETTYACHALIQEAVRWQLKVDEKDVVKPVRSQRPDGFNYIPLIERLTSLLYNEAGDNPLKKAIWLPYSESLLAYLTEETEELAMLSNNTVYFYMAIGNWSKSLEYGLKSLAIRERVLSPEHPSLANSYNNIACTYEAMEDLSKSLEYGLKSLAIREKILSPEHPDLATSYNNIANTYRVMGNLPKSLEHGLKALTIREKIFSPEHPDLAASYNNIAETHKTIGDLPRSLEYGLKSLAIFEEVLSPEHPDLAGSYNNIASTYQAIGNLPKGLEYGLKSLKIFEKVLSSEHPSLATSYNNIAGVYYYLQDYLQSLAYFQKAIQIRKKSLPNGHSHTKASIDSMAIVLQAAIDAGQLEAVGEYVLWYMVEVGEDAV